MVGGGPSGSTVAGLLAGAGRDVTLVDRAHFPREKACGECLNPGGVATLRRLGLLETVLATDPAPLEGWRLQTPEGISALGRFGPEVGHALGVRRGAFDHALLARARSLGVEVREGVQLQGITLRDGLAVAHGRRVATGRPWSLRARIVVGADGLRSMVARASRAWARPARRIKTSLSWHLEGPPPDELVGHLLLGGPFTSGLAPVQKRGDRWLWSQTVVVDPARFQSRLRDDPEGLSDEALSALTGSANPFSRLGPPRASGPFDHPVRWAARGRVLLVGDAAGYYDPLTGQGIYRALRSAELAAPILLRSLDHPSDRDWLMESYDQALQSAFGSGRRLQRLIDHGLDRPALRRAAIGLLGRQSGAASTLVGVTGDRLPPRRLLWPVAWSTAPLRADSSHL